MHRLFLLMSFLGFMACQTSQSEEDPETLEARLMYENFAQQFDSLPVSPTDTINCEELIYGLANELAGATAIHLATSEVLEIIPQELLVEAAFDSTEHHYALGRFSFSPTHEGFLMGAYISPLQHSTHLYLYDKKHWGFTHTLSLNYTLAGGAFYSERLAWICDLNQDSVMDVVFNWEQSLQTNNPEESYVKKEMHAEIWDGYQFIDYPANAIVLQDWDSVFIARELFDAGF